MSILIIMNNAYFSNKIYTAQKICYDNTYSQLSQISTLIKQTPGFNSATKIVFLGHHDSFPLVNDLFPIESFLSINDMLPISDKNEKVFVPETIPGFNRSLIAYPENYSIVYTFIRNFLGDTYTYITDINQINEIKNIDEVKQMPIYPNNGSVKCINDYIVIKLSD